MDDATYDFEEEGEQAAKPKPPGFPVEPRRLLRILADHRKPLLKGFLIATAVALLASLFVPKTYESTAQLLFEGTPLLQGEGSHSSADAFVESAMTLGVLFYAGIGVLGFFRGSAFLDYRALGNDMATAEPLGMSLIEVGVGVTVASVMVTIFYSFAGRGR